MSEQGFVDATWVGPAGYATVDGVGLVPGETVVSIPAGEAEALDTWEAPAAPSKSTEKKGS